MLSGESGAAAYSGERSGGGSHWGEWRGGNVLSGTRKVTAVSRAGNCRAAKSPAFAGDLNVFDAILGGTSSQYPA